MGPTYVICHGEICDERHERFEVVRIFQSIRHTDLKKFRAANAAGATFCL
jgi:hypothetical protein